MPLPAAPPPETPLDGTSKLEAPPGASAGLPSQIPGIPSAATARSALVIGTAQTLPFLLREVSISTEPKALPGAPRSRQRYPFRQSESESQDRMQKLRWKREPLCGSAQAQVLPPSSPAMEESTELKPIQTASSGQLPASQLKMVQ